VLAGLARMGLRAGVPQVGLAQSASPESPPPLLTAPSSPAAGTVARPTGMILPPINITATRPKLRAKPATHPATTTPNASSAAQQAPAVPPSGAPNVGAGPAAAPGMARQMTATGDDLNARPVTRPGEVLEAATGLIVTQHSGEGKADRYFLRGYNLDHGTDTAITVEDVLINLRTHARGQGYSDLNFLMPEAVNGVDIPQRPLLCRSRRFRLSRRSQCLSEKLLNHTNRL
jgi:hypothetical protein